jgi:hypothetical protein
VLRGLARLLSQSTHDRIEEIEIAYATSSACRAKESLGRDVHDRCIVLMDAGKQHTLRLRADTLRDRFPERVEGLITDFAPVETHKHKGLFPAE